MPEPEAVQHGTEAGVRWHQRKHERQCDACRALSGAVPLNIARPTAPCGTSAAARRHRRKGEPLCPPCQRAERDRPDRREPSSMSVDTRETRNGMPKPKAYRWRGIPDWRPENVDFQAAG